VFLQADAGTREQRRALEGHVDQIAERDLRDSSRTTAPLRPAENALMIDTSHLSLDEVVARIREAAGA
jgi:cytidylate kinase